MQKLTNFNLLGLRFSVVGLFLPLLICINVLAINKIPPRRVLAKNTKVALSLLKAKSKASKVENKIVIKDAKSHLVLKIKSRILAQRIKALK